ncbi:MAG: polysaccharide pyruvyl transferase family protein [Sphingomonadaceae bacterium]
MALSPSIDPTVPKGEGDAIASPLNVLLVGYNGANNTGAEALLLSDIQDVRAVVGPDAQITVPALEPANLRRYIQEGPRLRIAKLPTVFPATVRRLVAEHDLVLLVEGSTYMDSWGSPLLWAFLWTTWCAHSLGKPCLAYAVDAGDLSPFNRRLVRLVASRTKLIVARSQAAADRLRSWQVSAPLEATADNAFNFSPSETDEGWVLRDWPLAAEGIVGIAAVDFHLWPVVARPWGRREDCYRWPFYFSRSPERRRASIELATGYASLAEHIVERHGRAVALICMEQVDEPLATEIQRRMAHADHARVFSSRKHDASQMTALLRSLDLLVTSRFHAGVLSLAARVPQVAIGHDRRLDTLYRDLGLRDDFFVESRSPAAFEALEERVERLLADPGIVAERLRRGYEHHLARAQRNRKLLRAFVASHLPSRVPLAIRRPAPATARESEAVA